MTGFLGLVSALFKQGSGWVMGGYGFGLLGFRKFRSLWMWGLTSRVLGGLMIRSSIEPLLGARG